MSAGTVRGTGRVRAGAPFSVLPVPDGVTPLVLDLAVGPVSAFRADVPGGVPARGVALVVPGFTGSKEDHRLLLPLLAAHGYDAWTYSQRGQGDSVAPEGVDAYGLDDFTGDALEVAEIVRDVTGARDLHLVGHSFGGVVAGAAAIRDPRPFADLTMLCSGPRGWAGRKDVERARLVGAGGVVDLWTLDNAELSRRIEVRPAVLDALDAETRFLRDRSIATSVDNLLGAIDVLEDPTDLTPGLAATGLPVLVAHGVDDAAWPQEWQHDMAGRLGGRYAVIDGAGHLPNIENPDATAALLADFWAGRPPGPPGPQGGS